MLDRRIIFRQRDIPAGVPREGHAEDATKYGYRIPSLLVTKKGSILAFSERRLGLYDHAQNDIVLRRSTDGGKTWGAEIVAHEDDMNSINDPLTVQLENGRILPSVACMGSVIKSPVQEDDTWNLWASFPSNAGRKDGQIAVSKDNGKTWRIVKVIHGPFAYSALQVSPDQSSLFCLYESDGYRTETLITIPFDEVDHWTVERE